MSARVERPLLRQATRPLVALFLVVTTGITGYTLLAGIGPVEAAFWLLDLTSVELHFQTHDGPERLVKAFAIAVQIGLVLSTVWIGETVVTAAFGGRIGSELKTVQRRRQIDDLNGHVIICGYGIFGRTIATKLRAAGRDVVALESDPEEFEQIDENVLALQGDARREKLLREAGIERADVLVAAIDDSNVNIQIAITASQIAPELEVVVRVGDEMYESLARRAGADRVIIPEVVSGERVTEDLSIDLDRPAE